VSLVLTGSRRVYVLLLFRERLGRTGAAVQSRRRAEAALGDGPLAVE
jgi:hypothetical protein